MSEHVNRPDKNSGILDKFGHESQVEFEIDFFGKILEKNPEYVAVLRAMAHSLTLKGRYSDGLALDRRLVQLRPKDPMVHYNLACSYSLLFMFDQALQTLDHAIQLGYDDVEHMFDDPDLSLLREDRRFIALLEKYWKSHLLRQLVD